MVIPNGFSGAAVAAALVLVAIGTATAFEQDAKPAAKVDGSLRDVPSVPVVPVVDLPMPPQAEGPTTQPADSRPSSRPTSPDVPAWSKDALLDGMKAVVRELMLKGFVESERAALGERIRLILAVGDVGDDVGRVREAESLATTLFEIQRDYRPKDAVDPKRLLTQDEEQRVRIMAEALARDLYRRLPKDGVAVAGAAGHDGTFRAAAVLKPPPGFEAVNWSVLGSFDYVEGMKLPDEVQQLNGKKIAIAGYMMTLDQVENIREFLIVESLWSCCFGVPPMVNQVLLIQIEGRRGVEYTSMPVVLAGTLEVGEKIEDGFVTSLYRIKVAGPQGVKPAE